MTLKELKDAIEVMTAFAEGKEIEAYCASSNEWGKTENPTWDWLHYKYRIKKEPAYRPFQNSKECWAEMQKHQPFGWVKRSWGNAIGLVSYIDPDGVVVGAGFAEACAFTGYDHLFKEYTFIDGELFGIKK